MLTDWIKYTAAFAGLVFFQVLILNNVNIGSGMVNPYVYPLFILILPFNTPKVSLLLLAFVTGLIIDTFSNTPGLHAASLVLMAYLRPYLLLSITPKSGYDLHDKPQLRELGFSWFLLYSSLLLLAHHSIYFFLEVFSFNRFHITLSRVFLSLIASLIIVFLLEYIFGKKSPRSIR